MPFQTIFDACCATIFRRFSPLFASSIFQRYVAFIIIIFDDTRERMMPFFDDMICRIDTLFIFHYYWRYFYEDDMLTIRLFSISGALSASAAACFFAAFSRRRDALFHFSLFAMSLFFHDIDYDARPAS